ncbi:MAG: bifunctional DNA primase/polymerase [Candidatus Sigynarchaeota archaeon]
MNRDVHVQTNGAILTGLQPDGRILSVIDLDVADGSLPLPLWVLDYVSLTTYVVRSGRGGLHVYFYTDEEVPGAKHVESKHPLVHQVDRRGHGGIIFAPGCRFSEHSSKLYTIALDNPIRSISTAEFWRIWDIYGKTRYEVRVAGSAKTEAERHEATIRKARAAGKKDVPRVPREIGPDDASKFAQFPPCIAALLVCCARGEHLYHEERFVLACYMHAIGKDPEREIIPLYVNMPDYDERVTRKQVQHIIGKGYKVAGCSKLKAMGMCPRDCGQKSLII